jgi:hypothetical protein
MKTFVAMVVALAATTSVAFAGEPAKKPTKLTEVQMDQVTAGSLIRIDVNNVLNNNNVDVRVPVDIHDVAVPVAAAVAVLGAAGAASGVIQ